MKKEKNSFRGKIIRTAQKHEQARKTYGYLNLPKGVKNFNLEKDEKKASFDFLPYIVTDERHPDHLVNPDVAGKDALWYRRPIKVHKDVGPNNETVICPTSIGKKCPICEYRVKRIKEGAEKEEYKQFFPKDRSLYIIIPKGAKNAEEVPHVWDMSDFLFEKLLQEELQENEENEDFADLENGKTAEIRFRWETIGTTTYPEPRTITFTERDAYDEKILEDIPSLDEILKVLSYEELNNKFLEMDVEPDAGELKEIEEEEEEDTPKRVKKTITTQETKNVKTTEDTDDDKPVKRTVQSTTKQAPQKTVKDVEEEKPVRTVKKEVKTKAESNGCPYGHMMGRDFEKFDDCSTCNSWDDCYDKHKGR